MWEASSCRHLGHIPHPAHAKFVICDCTIENRLHYRRDVTLCEDAWSGFAREPLLILFWRYLTLLCSLSSIFVPFPMPSSTCDS
jgi:hypothetical protein